MATSLLFDRKAPHNASIHHATRLPTTFRDLRESAYDSAIYNNRYTSQMSTEREVQDEQYEQFLFLNEERDENFDRTKVRAESAQYYSLKKSEALGRYARNDREAYYAAMYDRYGDDVPNMETIQRKAAERAAMHYDQFQQDLQHTITEWPRTAMIAGEIQAAFSDPAQLAMMAAASPVAITSRMLAGAGVEAGINLAIDAPLMAVQREWYAKQGRELTNDDIANQLAASVLIGATFGAGASGLYKWAGGTNTELMPDPTRDSGRIGTNWIHRYGEDRPEWMSSADVAAERERSRNLDDLRRQVLESTDNTTGPYAFDSGVGARYYEDGDVVNPFKQSVPDGALTITDNFLYGGKRLGGMDPYENPQLRNDLLAKTRQGSFLLSNPYRYAPSMPLDRYTMYHSRGEVDTAHRANMEEAVVALSEGRAPSVPQRVALTVELTLDDQAARLGDLNDLIEGKVALSMKSAAYRNYLLERIRSVMGPRLAANVEAMADQLPADRQPLKPTVSKPTRSREQLDEAHDKILDSAVELQFKRKQLQDEKNAGHTFANEYNRAAKEGLPLPEKPKGMRTLKAIKRDEAKLGEQTTKLNERQQALRASEAQWGAYDADIARVDAINEAIAAEKALADLNEGKLPDSLRDLRTRLDEQYQTLKEHPSLKEEVLDAGGRQILDQYHRKTGIQYDHDRGYEVDPMWRDKGDTFEERVNATMYEELNRVDGNFEITLHTSEGDERTLTVNRLKNELDRLDEAVDAANVCGLGGGDKT